MKKTVIVSNTESAWYDLYESFCFLVRRILWLTQDQGRLPLPCGYNWPFEGP